MTLPTRGERARRTRPTEHLARRIRLFARESLMPISRGTTHRAGRGFSVESRIPRVSKTRPDLATRAA